MTRHTTRKPAKEPTLFLQPAPANSTVTSQQAAAAITPRRDTIVDRILKHIAWCGPRGATQEEISQACCIARATVAAACNTLGKAGQIVALEATRDTKAKTPAMVHITPDHTQGRPLMDWPVSNAQKASEAIARLHTRINQLEQAHVALADQLERLLAVHEATARTAPARAS